MKNTGFLLLTVLLVSSALAATSEQLASCRIGWDSPSRDSLDSMPLSGRMGAGANVWVQDGSIWFYLAHHGAYDEQGRLLKLGCVAITPVDFKLGDTGFRQELDPATGTIAVQQGDFKASLWFAGETLVFESTSARPRALEVAFGTWRDQNGGKRAQRMSLLQPKSGRGLRHSKTLARVPADHAGGHAGIAGAAGPRGALSHAGL